MPRHRSLVLLAVASAGCKTTPEQPPPAPSPKPQTATESEKQPPAPPPAPPIASPWDKPSAASPEGAATFEEARAAVRVAAKKRDFDTLAHYISDDFMYSLSDEPSRSEALRTWSATPALLTDLVAVLKRCQREGRYQICGKAGQVSAWFEERNGRWLMTAFAEGD